MQVRVRASKISASKSACEYEFAREEVRTSSSTLQNARLGMGTFY